MEGRVAFAIAWWICPTTSFTVAEAMWTYRPQPASSLRAALPCSWDRLSAERGHEIFRLVDVGEIARDRELGLAGDDQWRPEGRLGPLFPPS